MQKYMRKTNAPKMPESGTSPIIFSKDHPTAAIYTLFLLRSLKLHSEPFTRPDAFAIHVEHDRKRTQCQSNKPKQRVAPAQTERVVHLLTGEWKQSTGQRAEDGVGGHGGGSVDSKCVN